MSLRRFVMLLDFLILATIKCVSSCWLYEAHVPDGTVIAPQDNDWT